MYELFYKIYFDSELTEAQEVYYAGESVVVDIAGDQARPTIHAWIRSTNIFFTIVTDKS